MLPAVNVSDGRWHNVTLHRVGNRATLEVTTNNVVVGRVSGSKGTHRLLDASGVLYVGGYVYTTVDGEIKVTDNFEG